MEMKELSGFAHKRVVVFVMSGLFTGSKMSALASSRQDLKTRDLVLTRVFDVPVERVWKAWSDSEHVKSWAGSTGFTAPVADEFS